MFECIEEKWIEVQELDMVQEEADRKILIETRKQKEKERVLAQQQLEDQDDSDIEQNDNEEEIANTKTTQERYLKTNIRSQNNTETTHQENKEEEDHDGNMIQLNMTMFTDAKFPCAVQPNFRAWINRVRKKDFELSEKVMAYVGKLVQGQFRVGDKGTSTLAKSLKSSSTPHGFKLFECKFKFRNKAWRILWDRTPMLSKDQTDIGKENIDFIFCEHIRLWNVVSKKGNKQQHAIEEIHQSYARGLESRICKNLIPLDISEKDRKKQNKQRETDGIGTYEYPQTYTLKNVSQRDVQAIEKAYMKSRTTIIPATNPAVEEKTNAIDMQDVVVSAPVGSANHNHYGIHPAVRLDREAVYSMLYHNGR